MSSANFSISPVRRPSPENSPAAASEFLEGRGGFSLELEDGVFNGIRRQAVLSPHEEVGGIFLGRHYRNADGSWIVVVTDHLGVPSESRSVLSFEFDKSSIQAIFTRLSTGKVHDYVVGWYHSHVDGEPFMSVLDDKLHRDHFSEEWHVSCVVSAGAWGVPAGFWRFVDNLRVPIDEYSIRMTGYGSASDRHRSYLESCNVRDSRKVGGSLVSDNLVRALGLAQDGVLGRSLRRCSMLANTASNDGLNELRFLVDLAMSVGKDPAALGELGELAKVIAKAHSRNAVFRQVLSSDQIGSSLVVFGSDCYSYDPGDVVLQRFDINRRIVVPIHLTAKMVSAAFDPSGFLWLLLSGNLAMRVGSRTGQPSTLLDFDYSVLRLPKSVQEPLEIAASDDALWLRSVSRWHQLGLIHEEDEVSLGPEETGELPTGECRFVQGWAADAGHDHPHLVQHAGGCLSLHDLSDGRWVPRTSTILPGQFCVWDLVNVGLGDRCYVVLFNDGTTGQMLHLDRRTLEIVRHVLSADDDPVEGLTADHLGRVFIQAGQSLYRM